MKTRSLRRLSARLLPLWLLLFSLLPAAAGANPVRALLERLEPGASRHFVLERTGGEEEFFELESRKGKVVVRANNNVNLATGIHWYLKHYLHASVSWNNRTVHFPDTLPALPAKERHETGNALRYDLNYCTHSYSMAFWDWERWEQEIDWMALHGINLPLAITGTECVWFNLLKRLGYGRQEIDDFICGPGFFAWWLMNNLEGWGGPNPDSWYERQEALQKKIVRRMHELDIHPVFAGYSGMVPHDAREKLGLEVADPGRWCGYRRPAFLQPTDPNFARIAGLYYEELTRLFGKADYYSMDPFHEGGNTEGVDLQAAGAAIVQAMKHCNPKAVWVVQAWGENPREPMVQSLERGDLLVLDLWAEKSPHWGETEAEKYATEGKRGHDWLYCMLLNYGGNVGLHGKMQHVIDEYFRARASAAGETLRGVGMTMEGIENNPVMYELLCELPWHGQPFSKEDWLRIYVTARYGRFHPALYEAWLKLGNSIYNCPPASAQQGTSESIFCVRPSDNAYQASTWSGMSDYYDPHEVIAAARLFLTAAGEFQGNNNYEYDLVDITRQAVAEQGRMVYRLMRDARRAGEKELFTACGRRFMELLHGQDRLLSTRPEFRLDTWEGRARSLGRTPQEQALYVWNARVQVTTWGNRTAADAGKLHDYAHKEWSGLLSGFYAMRWQAYIDATLEHWEEDGASGIDYYSLEEQWVGTPAALPAEPSAQPDASPVEVACELLATKDLLH